MFCTAWDALRFWHWFALVMIHFLIFWLLPSLTPACLVQKKIHFMRIKSSIAMDFPWYYDKIFYRKCWMQDLSLLPQPQPQVNSSLLFTNFKSAFRCADMFIFPTIIFATFYSSDVAGFAAGKFHTILLKQNGSVKSLPKMLLICNDDYNGIARIGPKSRSSNIAVLGPA